jgi:Siphovirus Gp157
MNVNTSQLSSSASLALFPPVETEAADVTSPQALAKAMSIFELDESLCLLMDSAEEAAAENNGEIPQELQQALLEYCQAFGQKVDNIANYIRSQEFEAASAAAEIERLAARKSAAQNRVERLKGLLRYFLESRGTRSMKGRLNTISLRKNSQDTLVLTDTTKLGKEFWRISVVANAAEWEEALSHLPAGHRWRARFANPVAVNREPDNARIRAALAGGAVLEGAELRRGHHVRLT